MKIFSKKRWIFKTYVVYTVQVLKTLEKFKEVEKSKLL